ncbi:peptidoglycan D,D-transpeptidase FtsI family protein [Luteimicrobium subarcticum]|uniref:Cell elongation-specific peptidoglycan D,D-transpeptidase n=1 Tax=Luteimicrobium subarcticum TaxID=620910 RepID=A0A2M8WJE5_9MICO|nr:penicillin-binding transpeptidase domain-containing protein [Luteimicrobium subarcticum]PJI91051.1 cell elongation-specific peptidoglycan D,D-transpeptidase [Luteimicrobium subarcticum]
MNVPIRRLATVVLVMMLALMAATTYYQYFRAGELNTDGRNVRTIYREYGVFRGPIVVGGTSVAVSDPVDDPFKYLRSYSKGSLYAPVTGFYSVTFGRTQIEDSEDDVLNGSADELWMQRVKQSLTGQQQQGSSVELTIDPKAQAAAAKGLGDQRGAVVAIEPSTGKILALYSSPSFDPNLLAAHDTKKVNENYQKLLNASGSPLTNRAIAGDTYPPGSTFKLVTSAAALENGDYSPDTQIDAPNELPYPNSSKALQNYGGEVCSPTGKMSLEAALEMSCNTAFAQLGLDLGDDALVSQAKKFGFDTDLSVPMTVTQSHVPPTDDKAQTMRTAIGQGDVTATPMQIAMISATIANGGREMQPYLVQTVRDPDLKVVSEAEPQELRESVSTSTARQLTDMMIGVVQSGTGTPAQIPGVEVAGKTGTAENAAGQAPHAWFTGFAPADDPKVAVAVIVEHGGSATSEATGGTVAAPIAKAVIQAVLGG